MPTATARALALLAGVVVLVVFWHSPLLYPFRIFVVLAHELGHAIAAWVTGGSVERIALRLDESGDTLTRGGSPFVILNAGYLGSLLFGVAQLVLTSRGGVARWACHALGAGTLVLAAFFVRPLLSLGFLYCLVAGLGYALVGRFAPEPIARGLVRGTGLFAILYAFRDIVDDVFVAGAGDASALAAATHVPAFVWGSLWILLGLGALWVFRRRIVGG